jgi:hypothetical protein
MGGDAAAMATALEATRAERETCARGAVRPRAPRRAKAGETRAGAARAAAVAIASLSRRFFSEALYFFAAARQISRSAWFRSTTLLSAFRFPTHEWISTERAERSVGCEISGGNSLRKKSE